MEYRSVRIPDVRALEYNISSYKKKEEKRGREGKRYKGVEVEVIKKKYRV